MIKKILTISVFVLTVIGCRNKSIKHDSPVQPINFTIEDLIVNLENSRNDQIMVAAHRGDWRNAPENSLQAIQNCIDMGVDIVEIDIRETKDGELVVIHDDSLNRTTNGRGYIKDWTLDSLKTLRLRDGLGVVTQHRIPTLEEALMLSRNKILVNLDKGYRVFEKVIAIVQKTGTTHQVIFKGRKSKDEVEKEIGKYLDEIYFMPIIKLNDPSAEKTVKEYLTKIRLPVAFEFTVPQDTIRFIEYFAEIRKKGASVWVNSLWPQHNGGHDDEKAAIDTGIYNWYIENHIDIIQTDRPELLLSFLRERGLHR
ncbi:MAG: glycerophosphodiester phosphodiesterase family protein [Flavobacteriaceae bacterium]